MQQGIGIPVGLQKDKISSACIKKVGLAAAPS